MTCLAARSSGALTSPPPLGRHATAVALLDRLLHHAVTVVTSGDSYRMKEARTKLYARSLPGSPQETLCH